ncbi:MAG: hypothetical protein AAF821_19435 [Cyanobacteria bacterium P01_D01_bin.156]
MTTQRHSLVRHIIEQLPPEQRYTFTEQQIEALHQSALALPKAKHALNLRLSIPFPGNGFYLVFFAGEERRSRKRLLADSDFQLLPKIAVVSAVILGCVTVFGVAHSQRILAIARQQEAARLDDSPETVHPTVVPFKYDQEQCETSHREWKDGQCFDYEHDHTF